MSGGVPQGSVLRRPLFLLFTPELFSIVVNKLIGYANDSKLMAVVPSPGVRVVVADYLNGVLGKVSEWNDLWRMKLDASKTKTMVVPRSTTMHPQLPPINYSYWWNCAEGV